MGTSPPYFYPLAFFAEAEDKGGREGQNEMLTRCLINVASLTPPPHTLYNSRLLIVLFWQFGAENTPHVLDKRAKMGTSLRSRPAKGILIFVAAHIHYKQYRNGKKGGSPLPIEASGLRKVGRGGGNKEQPLTRGGEKTRAEEEEKVRS